MRPQKIIKLTKEDFQAVCKRLEETDDKIADMAKDLGLPAEFFNRWFHNNAGQTASEHRRKFKQGTPEQNWLKFFAVRHLLIENEKSIPEIRKEFNFRTSDFSPWFHQYQRLTPCDFRARAHRMQKSGSPIAEVDAYFRENDPPEAKIIWQAHPEIHVK